jgi:hypothetical protein
MFLSRSSPSKCCIQKLVEKSGDYGKPHGSACMGVEDVKEQLPASHSKSMHRLFKT